MSLVAELKRRHVFKVGAAYVVVAWLVIQVASIALPAFAAPPWVLRVFILVLMLGFPFALVMAWAFQATPEGLKLEAAPVGNKRMAAIAGGLAALALAWYFIGQPAVRDGKPASAAANATPAPMTAPQKSIAVLPFVNMSADKDNEYFSDGVSEEILNALAKVDGLKVAGRTSSFQFKGSNESLTSIGETLGVAHVLEGSVRKQGDRVRITAQLIQVKDGFHLWSETYDGDLADVFELQERIARSITGALEVVLQGAQAKRLVNAGTANPEAYALYLQASATFNRRDAARYSEAMAQLGQATRLDPGFARAYSRLAALHAVALNADTIEFDVAMAAVEKFARRALQIDPSLAEPHAVLGLAFNNRRQYRESNASFARALALEPDDVTTNFWRAVTWINSGYRRQGISALDRTLQLDPLLPNALVWRGREHVADGELDEGERLLRRAAEGGHSFVGISLSKLERARGNREAAMSQLAAGLRYFTNAFPEGTEEVFARACFGDAAAKTRALALIDDYLATRPTHLSGLVPYVLIHTGEPARAFALLQDKPTNNDSLVMGELFGPPLAEARRAPEFAVFVRRMGLAAHWDAFGAPEPCRKNAAGDYACS